MNILLDNTPSDLTATTVTEAIDVAAAAAQGQGRLITDITVDGQPWDHTTMADSPQASAAAGTIDITTADATELLSATLADAISAMDQIETLQQSTADAIESSDHAAAMTALAELLGIWGHMEQAASYTVQLMGIGLDQPLPDTDITARSVGDHLTERLGQLREALTNQDLIGIADTLRYDFPECASRWRTLLIALRHLVCTTS